MRLMARMHVLEAASPGIGNRTEWILVEFAKPQTINYIKTMSDGGAIQWK